MKGLPGDQMETEPVFRTQDLPIRKRCSLVPGFPAPEGPQPPSSRDPPHGCRDKEVSRAG